MKDRTLVDTGVLVAAFDQSDAWARWVAMALKQVSPPMVTCEAILAETWFLLRHRHDGWGKVVTWLEMGYLKVDFSFSKHREQVVGLMEKYRNLPMSLADASLVAMVESGIGDRVFTLDRHFRTYRHSGRRVVPVLMPER